MISTFQNLSHATQDLIILTDLINYSDCDVIGDVTGDFTSDVGGKVQDPSL